MVLMEAESRRRSLRRKPLADCTNTIEATKATAAAVAGANKKPVNSTLVKKINPLSDITNDKNRTSISSKPITSTGSNSSVSTLVRVPSATPRQHLAPPPPPPQTRSRFGTHGHQDSKPASVQVHSRDAQTRKFKGSSVVRNLMAERGCDNEKSSAVSHTLRQLTQKAMDKGKTVADSLDQGHQFLYSQRQDARKRKDKGNTVAEDPPTERDEHNLGRFVHHTQKQDEQRKNSAMKTIDENHTNEQVALESAKLGDEQRRKAKGKMLMEDDVAEQITRDHEYARQLDEQEKRRLAGNIPSGDHTDERIAYPYEVVGPPIHVPFTTCSPKKHEQTEKNMGKTDAEGHAIEHGGCTHEKAKPISSQISSEQELTRKPNEPSTPCSASEPVAAASASSFLSNPHDQLPVTSASSGTTEQQKPECVTVYPRKRGTQGRKYELRSCPPAKRNKDIRSDTGDKSGKSGSGSFTDPIRARKKKRYNGTSTGSNRQSSGHGMPQNEIEKLRAYFAEVDAFDLPEEEASDND